MYFIFSVNLVAYLQEPTVVSLVLRIVSTLLISAQSLIISSYLLFLGMTSGFLRAFGRVAVLFVVGSRGQLPTTWLPATG